MAVPKKRTGHSAQGHRRSNWKATKPETTKCAKCGELVLTHTICTACGYYKGKAVSIKSPDYTEMVETKKTTKKTAAKAKSKEVEEAVSSKQEEVKEAVVKKTETKKATAKKTTKKETTTKKASKTKKAEE